MKVSLLNIIPSKQTTMSFGHGNPWSESTYNTKEKAIVAGTTALGVIGALSVLAKVAKHSLSPKKAFKNITDASKILFKSGNCSKSFKTLFRDFKKSYIYKAPYDEPEVVTIGAGSCLGGLAGGYIIDKDKENRKAKLRETLLQIANISVPIFFVGRCAAGGKYLGGKYFEKPGLVTWRTKLPKAIFAIAGLFGGVFVGNIVGNKINELIFNRGKGRKVQASDFSAHLDDFCFAARQIDEKNPIIHGITMCVPLALMVAGNEVGNKKA